MAEITRPSLVTPQQAVVHALFVKHRSMSVVARLLGLSQIRVREALVQHERNRLRDAGQRPPPLKEMLRGDVTTRFGVPRAEFGGRPAKHEPATAAVVRPHHPTPTPRVVMAGASVRRFIITGAEPGADIHAGFWINLKAYAAAAEAEIVVLQIGVTITTTEPRRDYSRFVADAPIDLAGVVDVAADEMIPARLVRPLESVRDRADARWTIFPHPAICLETLARMRAHGLRMHMTSGAITLTRGGSRRSVRELGAVIVEVSGKGVAHCRHLIASSHGDGSFQDLDAVVSGGLVERNRRIQALTFGDVHHAHLDASVAAATWGIGTREAALVDRLRPHTMVFHDVVDFDARNHHDARDHHKRFAQFATGGGDVGAELAAASAFLAVTRRVWAESVVVGSNHDAALLRWLRDADFRDDATNALFFLETSLELHRSLAGGFPADGIFEQTMRRLSADRLSGVRFLRLEESLEIAGVEHAIHGHVGADGRPGDVRYFERLGIRATLGHTHRPLTRDAIYCAGACATGMAYARGPMTAWAVGHVVTYATGARQHLIFDGGSFHA